MAALTSYTHAITADQAGKLRGVLLARGFDLAVKPYCLYAASKAKLNVAVYEKGPKIVVQGKETEDFVTNILEPQIFGVAELGYEEVTQPETFQPHLGIDESGKGDFFGPLVVAGVYVDPEIVRSLKELGVMDSKRISSDARICKLAAAIRAIPRISYEVLCIGPDRYNQLYEKIGNLNRLLAWGHAKTIEMLLEKRPDCPRAISDQFANPAVLQRSLQERGRKIELVQRTKAESDPAVAAASILAREKFVSWLAAESARIGFELPKGVSPAVKEAATRIIATEGTHLLGRYAKMHFKTAGEVLGGVG